MSIAGKLVSSKLGLFAMSAGVNLLLAGAVMAQEGHPAEGHAAEPGVLPTGGEGIAPMIVSIVVFIVVLGILSKTAWPKIVSGLQDREQKIRSEIEAAELAQKQAKSALEQYEKNLADARAEAQKMLSDALAKQQVLVAEQKAKAETELNQMRDRARKDIETAKQAAIKEIYDQAGELATSMATKILRREVTPKDQQRLMEESLAELAAMKN